MAVDVLALAKTGRELMADLWEQHEHAEDFSPSSLFSTPSVRVSIRKSQHADCPEDVVKAATVLEGIPLEKAVALVLPWLPYRTQWDTLLAEAPVVVDISPYLKLVHHITRKKWPLGPRDSVDVCSVERRGATVAVGARSVDVGDTVAPLAGYTLLQMTGPRNRRPTLYGDSALAGFERPPSVTDTPHPTGHMESEEFEGDYSGKFSGKNTNNPKGAKGAVGKFLGGVQGAIDSRRGKGVNMTIREIVVFLLFLVILCIIAFASTSSNTYYFTSAMQALFVNSQDENGYTFSDVSTMDDVWNYMNDQLVEGLYMTNDCETVTDAEGNERLLCAGAGVSQNDTENAMVYYENKLLGMPRIRMLKVTNDSCTVVDPFSREIKECFASYTFKWQSEEELSTGTIYGQMGTYGGGGFVALLPMSNKSGALEVIEKLLYNRWIERGTRAVLVDFSLYNANINLFCVCRLLFELPSTGGVIPTANFETLQLIRYVTTFDYFVLVCEGVFTAFTLFLVFEELLEIMKWRLRYFESFWNIIDVLVILLSIVTIVLSLNRIRVFENRVNILVNDDLEVASMDDAVTANNNYSNFLAVLLFFSWMKIFKYISFNKTMSQLSATLSRSAKDIGGFAVMFFIFFFAYAQFGYLCFGTQIQDYSTFYSAVFALLRTILGDFDFHALENANRVLGPTFFITYVFFVFFVLLNMFLAIINDTYVEVKQELEKQKSEYEIAEFVKTGFYRVLRFLHLTKSGDAEPQSDYAKWRHELTRRGYTDEEINDKFMKFNIDEGSVTGADEKEKIENELASDRDFRSNGTAQSNDTMALNRRIDHIENSIGRILGDMSLILDRFEVMEERKVLAKEHEVLLAHQSRILNRPDGEHDGM
ncbi:unnamed protein product, partial [Mesorhabditis spiculigera]